MKFSGNVPAGFSGWWCQRCERAAAGIPEDLDAAQAKCPHCHHWTAVWVPPANPSNGSDVSEPAARARRPRRERAAELFAHIRDVMEHPELNPDLSEIEHEETIR